MKVHKASNRGLTLVEMIIVVAMISILSIVIIYLITSTFGTWKGESTMVSLEDQLRAIQDVMVRDLRPCKYVYIQTISSTNQILYFSETATIPPVTGTTNFFQYNAGNKTLYRSLSGVSSPLSENNLIASFSAMMLTQTNTLVQITLSAQEGSTRKDIDFAVTLRKHKY